MFILVLTSLCLFGVGGWIILSEVLAFFGVVAYDTSLAYLLLPGQPQWVTALTALGGGIVLMATAVATIRWALKDR